MSFAPMKLALSNSRGCGDLSPIKTCLINSIRSLSNLTSVCDVLSSVLICFQRGREQFKMSTMTQSTSSSQYLSSTRNSLTPSKRASSETSKVYKHASQLYLTRRLHDAYEVLQPLITPSSQPNGHAQSDDETPPQAPIASATTSQRIKIWSLYITLLNAIVDLGLEEGGNDFGPKVYRSIVKNVRKGGIWEQVIRDGYRGREGSVDTEVVYNL